MPTLFVNSLGTGRLGKGECPQRPEIESKHRFTVDDAVSVVILPCMADSVMSNPLEAFGGLIIDRKQHQPPCKKLSRIFRVSTVLIPSTKVEEMDGSAS